MDPMHQEDLPQVAQYLLVKYNYRFLYSQLVTHFCEKIKKRHGDALPAHLREGSIDQIDELLKAAATLRWKANPDEPHMVLAKLPFDMYITTNPDSLLSLALKEAKKEPRVHVCPWNEDTSFLADEIEQQERDAASRSVDEPLVYHLFGQLADLESLVLTEDDYFDFLLGVTKNNAVIPPSVRRAMTDSMLMFLGFQLDDWNFRVLFRSILQRQGGNRRRKYLHVAVQIVPEDGRLLETERARKYLEKYFGNDTLNISIYWGSCEEFIRELRAEWNKKYGDKLPI
jgi:hypothetical protein